MKSGFEGEAGLARDIRRVSYFESLKYSVVVGMCPESVIMPVSYWALKAIVFGFCESV